MCYVKALKNITSQITVDSINLDFFYIYNKTIQTDEKSLFKTGPQLNANNEWPYFIFAPHSNFQETAMEEIIDSTLKQIDLL